MSKGPYQYLDELGIKEFITVVLERVDNLFKDWITSDVDEVTSYNKLISAKTTIDVINSAIVVLEELEEAVNNVKNASEDITNDVGIADIDNLDISDLIFRFITGSIEVEVPEPTSGILYFQRNKPTDTNWNLYVYEGMWKSLGLSEYIRRNYWSKDEIEVLLSRLIEAIPDDVIREIVRKSFLKVAGG